MQLMPAAAVQSISCRISCASCRVQRNSWLRHFGFWWISNFQLYAVRRRIRVAEALGRLEGDFVPRDSTVEAVVPSSKRPRRMRVRRQGQECRSSQEGVEDSVDAASHDPSAQPSLPQDPRAWRLSWKGRNSQRLLPEEVLSWFAPGILVASTRRVGSCGGLLGRRRWR